MFCMRMASPAADTEQLADAILATLALPPSQVGTRIRPEIDLAKKLNLGRAAIRIALDKLVQQGILVRRQGSGTYVRKVPSIIPGERKIDSSHAVSAEILFASADEEPVETSRLIARPSKRMHFSVWTDLRSRDSQLVVSGIVQQANRAGKHVSLHSLLGTEHTPESIAEELRDDPCDGYLILEPWAYLIEEALGKIDKPAVFFWVMPCPESKYSPLVVMDVFGFFHESILRLKQQGYQRIAAVALQTEPVDHLGKVESMYRAALSACGMKYSAIVAADLSIAGSYSQGSYEVTRELLARKGNDAPDAIVVVDDHLLSGAAAAVSQAGKKLGQDFGLISYANRGMPVGGEHEFSLLEQDQEAFGGILLDILVHNAERPGSRTPTVAISPKWKPGKTHLRSSSF